MKKSVLAFFGICLLSSATVLASEIAPVSAVELEQTISSNLMSGKIVTGPVRVTFKAWSGGCTEDTDFSLSVSKEGDKQILTILRLNEDICESPARLQSITLLSPELNTQKPIVVANPITTNIIFLE